MLIFFPFLAIPGTSMYSFLSQLVLGSVGCCTASRSVHVLFYLSLPCVFTLQKMH